MTCSTCISLNIQLLDMLHQPNTHHATHWNSICCWKWCTATHSSSRLQWSCCKQEQRWYFEEKKKNTFHQSKLNELKQSSRVGFQYDARVCSSAHACVVETSIQRVIVWVPVFVLFVWASWCVCGCDCVCGGCWSVRIIGSKTGFMQHSEVVPMSGHPQRMWSCKQLQASPSPLCLNISSCPEILIHLRGLYSLNAGAELRRCRWKKMHTTAVIKLVKFQVGMFWAKGWRWCK